MLIYMIRIQYLLTLLLASSLLACKSSSPKTPTYEVIANMRYMEVAQKVHAELRFRSLKNDGTSKLPISASFNTQVMKFIEAGGGVYLYDGVSSPTDGGHSYTWKTDANKSEQMKLSLVSMTEPSFVTPKLSHSSATQLKWKGDPLKKADSIVLLWEDQKNRATYTTQAVGASSVALLDIPAFELKKVPIGKYKVTVIRKTLHTGETQDYLVKAQGEYYHKPFEIEMTL
jgi:hypothetical protein